ncbi:MAG: glycosyltransferase [Sphingobacteriales bacterium]|nr:MAG: glycosyltransferase [Sphingobacteriales bacterium]
MKGGFFRLYTRCAYIRIPRLMKVSVIIVNYNVKYFLEVCLHAVTRALQGLEGEIIVADNNSADGSNEMVRTRFPEVTLIENKDNKGFSRANNQAVSVARGEYILFLNPDTVMPEHFLHQLIGYMDSHAEAGAIGPRLIDGKGKFAPDGKKSFPTLSVALFKTLGINRLFPRSAYFNKYYAVHIGEYETAAVDVLSGCCMMVRASVLRQIGGAFDEDYFMYCEDVDLCYRIQQAGYQNIYYPEATLIHYKGESTKKATLSYVRIFNEALITFVRKHYSQGSARLFIFFIHIGIALRAVLGVVKQVLKVLRMPIFDAIILMLTLLFIKEVWIEQLRNIAPIPFRSIYLTFPVYVLIWLASMFLNGAYDQPYRALRVIRGMLAGIVFGLAYYGLLTPELRHSRALIILTGTIGAILLVALHELFNKLGIFKLTYYDALPGNAVIVANEKAFESTAETLRQIHYAPNIYGRISPGDTAQGTSLTPIRQLKPFLYTADIDEVIFCVNGLGYAQILEQMQVCGERYEYKIHLPGSSSFVGSNSSSTAGDLYTIDRRFHLSNSGHLRNKRVLDILMALILLLLFPLALVRVPHFGSYIGNCFAVIGGRRTWVGYALERSYIELPPIRKGILPPFQMLENYIPGAVIARQMDQAYAQYYKTSLDMKLVIKNFRFLGRKSQKDFAEIES